MTTLNGLRMATALWLCGLVFQAGAVEAPVAEILGKPVTLADLDAGVAVNLPKPATADDKLRHRKERLRGLVWSAVFDDYARQRRLAPTTDEIGSNVRSNARLRAQLHTEREQQRVALVEELKSPSLSAARRQQAQQHLDTLERIRVFDAQWEQELRDPERRKMQQEAERQVAAHWVRGWKINQALYREFGGRIIFQQAGWEPIDAYRKLLDRYAAKKAFVVHDPALRDAVYGYFQHKFVYADETKAKFYFDKPWWERTPAELKAAGF
ncbi:MAG: hypothetical protein AAB346_00080 [Pseudomonadota bacterium]